MSNVNPYSEPGREQPSRYEDARPDATGSQTTQIRRIDILSAGKIVGAIYVSFGLVFGLLVSLIGAFGVFLGGGAGDGNAIVGGAILSLMAVVIYPLFLGVGGFIGGIITALIYNFVAGVVGGIRLELGP